MQSRRHPVPLCNWVEAACTYKLGKTGLKQFSCTISRAPFRPSDSSCVMTLRMQTVRRLAESTVVGKFGC